MPCADTKLHVITEAMTLPERIDLWRDIPHAFISDPKISNERLDTWGHNIGVSREELIKNRLPRLGINAEDLEQLLGRLEYPNGDTLETPNWWNICEHVMANPVHLGEGELPTADFLTKEGTSEPDDSTSESKEEIPLPFEHAIAPWIDAATDVLAQELPEIMATLSPAVLRHEQRGLLENLCIISRQVMLGLFQLKKLRTYDSNDMALGLLVPTAPRTVYISMVQGILDDGAEELIRTFPSLARLMATRVQYWIQSLIEFARHLEADRPDLERIYNTGEPLGALVKGGRGISDSHNGGRAVMVCTFECGVRIVFKPRDMSIDVAWNHLLDEFNTHAAEELQLKKMAILNRGSHGWMEFAERSPCKNEGEVQQYFFRMGSLLAIIHALQGNDFHLENIIAAGPNPIAIDLETISVPEPLPLNEDEWSGMDEVQRLASHSVLRTLLLPAVMATGREKEARSLGALGIVVNVHKSGFTTHRKLININTDFQRWATVPKGNPTLQEHNESTVTLASGDRVDTNTYRRDTAQGYTAAYQEILGTKKQWLSDHSPIALMEDAWVRVLNRSTQIYYRLVLESCNAELMASGVERWIYTDRLHVEMPEDLPKNKAARNTALALFEREQEAILRGDIAYFTATGGGLQYHTPDPLTGTPVPVEGAYLKTSATDTAYSQIAVMGEKDLELQQMLMESSYLTATISAHRTMHIADPSAQSTGDDDRPVPTHQSIEQWILRGLSMIDTLAIRRDGRTNWFGQTMDPKTETVHPSALDLSIYSGRGGIAMLMERAYRHFGDTRWLDLAKESINQTFQGVTQALKNGRFTGFDLQSPSGLMDRPGFIAACWAIGRHEGCGAYRELAHTLIVDMTDRTIKRDMSYDLIAGSAGYLLMSMHLERQEKISGLEPVLERLADHLMNSAADDGGPWWPSAATGLNNRPLCGFAHGRAGIGLALLEVGTRLNRTDLRKMGLETLHAEHVLRGDAPGDGWPDLRSLRHDEPMPKPPHAMNAWCSGSYGIAISRAGALAFTDDAFVRDDLDYAMSHIHSAKQSSRHHLCCGSSGSAETWRSIGLLTANPALYSNATDLLPLFVHPDDADPTAQHAEGGLGMLQGTSGALWAALSEIMEPDGSAILAMRT